MGKEQYLSWSRWYAEARDRMARHYGVRGIAKDRYKEMYAPGADISVACQQIWREFQARNWRGY